MPAQLITTCTNRKRAAVPFELDMGNLDRTDQSSLLSEWTAILRSSTELRPAQEMYCGRGFQEAVSTANTLGTNLLIVSAGLGLVEREDKIPSYNATLVKSSPASIQRKVDGTFDASQWWVDLNKKNGPRPLISDFVRSHPRDVVVITLSGQYVDLLRSDLLLLDERDINRLRIIGPTSAILLPVQLRRCFMPYDDRFDGPEGPCRGTRADFPQRATRHFVENFLLPSVRANFETHSKSVSKFLKPLPMPEVMKRKKLTDTKISEEIENSWHEASGNSAKMLRLFRDGKKIACEQGRFARLFNQVKMQRNSE